MITPLVATNFSNLFVKIKNVLLLVCRKVNYVCGRSTNFEKLIRYIRLVRLEIGWVQKWYKIVHDVQFTRVLEQDSCDGPLRKHGSTVVVWCTYIV